MNEAQAIQRLSRMLEGSPALDAPALSDLLSDSSYQVQQVDDNGDLVEDENGDPVYDTFWDLNRAASEGWLLKAGLVAGDYALNVDGQQMSRQQVYDHCLRQARYYASKVKIRPSTLTRTDVAV